MVQTIQNMMEKHAASSMKGHETLQAAGILRPGWSSRVKSGSLAPAVPEDATVGTLACPGKVGKQRAGEI